MQIVLCTLMNSIVSVRIQTYVDFLEFPQSNEKLLALIITLLIPFMKYATYNFFLDFIKLK